MNWVDPLGLAKWPTLTFGLTGEILTSKASVTKAELKKGKNVNASAGDAARSMGYQTYAAGHILANTLGGGAVREMYFLNCRILTVENIETLRRLSEVILGNRNG